ncbi:MAG TPA: hypothetical protein PKE31_04585 [Pseudomonadota bacterium]|nr:hypothetical protein [Pseudomonadota bacterium]
MKQGSSQRTGTRWHLQLGLWVLLALLGGLQVFFVPTVQFCPQNAPLGELGDEDGSSDLDPSSDTSKELRTEREADVWHSPRVESSAARVAAWLHCAVRRTPKPTSLSADVYVTSPRPTTRMLL